MTDNSLMRARILIEVTMSNIIDYDSLQKEYNGSLSRCVREMIKEEGHYAGLVDNKFKIVHVQQMDEPYEILRALEEAKTTPPQTKLEAHELATNRNGS